MVGYACSVRKKSKVHVPMSRVSVIFVVSAILTLLIPSITKAERSISSAYPKWTPPVNILTSPLDPEDAIGVVKLKIDGTNVAHMIWSTMPLGGEQPQQSLYYSSNAFSTREVTGWRSRELILTAPPDAAVEFDFALDSENNPHLVYTTQAYEQSMIGPGPGIEGKLYYTWRKDGQWQPSQLLDQMTLEPGAETSMPGIDALYGTSCGIGQTQEGIDELHVVYLKAVLLGTDLHYTGYEANGGCETISVSHYGQEVHYTSKLLMGGTVGGWSGTQNISQSTEHVDSHEGSSCPYTSTKYREFIGSFAFPILLVDNQNTPQVIYFTDSQFLEPPYNKSSMYYSKRRSDGFWPDRSNSEVIREISHDDGGIFSPKAAIDEEGGVYVLWLESSWSSPTYALNYKYRSAVSGWQNIETLVSSDNLVRSYHLAVDTKYPTYRPHLIYQHEGSFIYRTKVREDSVIDWSNPIPISVNGHLSSLAVDSNDYLHMAQVGMDSIHYVRTCEDNLGAQDAFAMCGAGPNASANLANGDLFFGLPLLSTRGMGISANLSLAYNSLETYPASVSQGWRCNYEIYVTQSRFASELNPSIILNLGDGRSIVFEFKTEYGYYVAQDKYGYFSRIEKTPDHVMTGKFGTRYVFNGQGKLSYIEDTNGNRMEFAYEDNPLTPGNDVETNLTRITDSVGRNTQLTYNQDNQVESVIDPAGKSISLEYYQDANVSSYKRLKSVTFDNRMVGSQITNYNCEFEYHLENNDDTNGLRRNLISKIKNPRGYETQYLYQQDNRFLKSVDAAGKSGDVIYKDAESKTEYTDRGSLGIGGEQRNTTTVEYDERSLATRIIDPMGNYIEREFDSYGNMGFYRDMNDNTTYYTYYNAGFGHVRDNIATIQRPGTDAPIGYTHTTDGLNRVASVKDALGNTTSYEYDAKGNLTDITYPLTASGTAVQSYEYDAYGRITISTDPEDNSTTYTYNDPNTGLPTHIYRPGLQPEVLSYDGMGNALQRQSPEGGTTAYDLDDLYRVENVVDPVSATTTYSRDENGNLSAAIDPMNNDTTYTYSNLDRMTVATDALDGTVQTQYDPNGNTIESIDPRNISTISYYSARNQMTRQIREGEIVNYEYDANGNLVKEKITRGTEPIQTVFRYDVRGNLTCTFTCGDPGPAGDTIPVDYYQYDDNDRHVLDERREETFGTGDQLISSVFCSGTYSSYDEQGRLIDTTRLTQDPRLDPLDPESALDIVGYTTTYEYYENGNRASVTNPRNKTTYFYYDENNRLYSTVDASGCVTNLYYDDNGNRTAVETDNPAGAGRVVSQRFTYNNRNELVAQMDAFGNTESYRYDLNGNLFQKTDAEGNVVEYEYDWLNRMTEMRQYLEPGGHSITTTHQYDKNGNRTKVIDPNGNEYKYEYEEHNRLERVIHPLGNSTDRCEHYEYNSVGELWWVTDANGRKTEYLYDTFGRMDKEIHTNGPTIEREYDAVDRLVRIIDGTVETKYEYDPLSRQTREVRRLNGVLLKDMRYEYDEGDNKIQMTGPSPDDVTTYGYDESDRLKWIRLNGQLVAQHYYTACGFRTKTELGNGSIIHRSYDRKGRASGIRTVKSNGALIAGFRYGYDSVGNRTRCDLEHLGMAADYAYNGVYWLTEERLSRIWPLAEPRWDYPHITHYRGAYTYDDAGNRLTKSTSQGSSTYVYDGENRLTMESASRGGVPIHAVDIQVDSVGGTSVWMARDSIGPGMSWQSEPAPVPHWAELHFGGARDVCQVRIRFPDGLEVQRFRIQYLELETWHDIDLSSAIIDGAMLQDGWLSSIFPEVVLSFGPVNTWGIRYYQDASGGSAYSPDTAYLDDFTAYDCGSEEEITYSYDNNGNQTGRFSSLGTEETYAYDYQNRLSNYSSTGPDQPAKSWSYTYAPTGERLLKTNLITEEVQGFVYDGPDVLEDYETVMGSSSRNSTALYVNGLAIDSKIARFSQDGSAYYICDALGTVHRTIDGHEQVLSTHLTTAWGEELYSFCTPDRYRGLAQREIDDESGLQYTRARMYDPRIGRFMEKDPKGYQDGSNCYVYASNSPAVLVDPSGLEDKRYGGIYVELWKQFKNLINKYRYPNCPLSSIDLNLIVMSTAIRKPGKIIEIPTGELDPTAVENLKEWYYGKSAKADKFGPGQPNIGMAAAGILAIISEINHLWQMARQTGEIRAVGQAITQTRETLKNKGLITVALYRHPRQRRERELEDALRLKKHPPELEHVFHRKLVEDAVHDPNSYALANYYFRKTYYNYQKYFYLSWDYCLVREQDYSTRLRIHMWNEYRLETMLKSKDAWGERLRPVREEALVREKALLSDARRLVWHKLWRQIERIHIPEYLRR